MQDIPKSKALTSKEARPNANTGQRPVFYSADYQLPINCP